MVKDPDYVVVARANRGPEVITSVAMVAVSGGNRFAGNGYKSGETFGKRFSFGVRNPQRIGIVTKSGQKYAIADAAKVLFCGGSDPAKPSAAMTKGGASLANLSQLISDHEPAHAAEIIDENDDQAHIVDNGASIEMADRTASGPDDFDDLLRRRNEALKAADGDDLAAFAIEQESHVQTVQAQAPAVNTNPASAIKAILGTNTVLTSGQSIEVARWTGDPSESRPVTIDAAFVEAVITTPAGVSLNGNVRPYVSVIYGSRGFSFTVEADLGTGARFTVHASSVILSLVLPDIQDPPNVPFVSLAVSGMISFGQCMRTAPVTRTLYGTVTGTSTFQIPKFARKLTVWRAQNTANQALDIQFSSVAAGTSFITFRRAASASTNEQDNPPSFLLPGDSTQVSVSLVTPPATVDVVLIFELGL